MKKGSKLIIIAFSLSLTMITGAFFVEEILILTKKIEKKMKVFAEEIIPFYFMPHYPDRIIFLVSELDVTVKDLVLLGKDTEKIVSKCECKNAKSICKKNNLTCTPIRIIGDPCSNRKEIEKKESEIKDKLERIERLKGLLEKEKDIYSQQEKETLESQIGSSLFNRINDLISKVNSEVLSKENNLSSLKMLDSTYCIPRCSSSFYSGRLKLCLKGEQSPIKAKFNVGVKIDDLDIGPIGIRKLRLNLPKQITLAEISFPNKITIPLPEIVINFPEIYLTQEKEYRMDLSNNFLIFHSPSFSSFQFPPLSSPQFQSSLSFCPEQISSSKNKYSPVINQGGNQLSDIEVEWYSQNFEWLTDKCLNVNGFNRELSSLSEVAQESLQKDENSKNYFNQCFDPRNVVDQIIDRCNKYRESYDIWGGCIEDHIPTFCRTIRFYCGRPSDLDKEKNIKASAQCIKLFQSIGERGSQQCYYKKDPLGTLRKKCEDIKKGLKQKREEEQIMPEPCKYVPIFEKNFPLPSEFEYKAGKLTLPEDKINDFPKIIPGCGTGIDKITTPKIDLPDIVVPDIKLPRFNFCPIVSVTLPSFIFEDLVLPEFDLCDIDNCLDFLPNLNLLAPPIKMPEIPFIIDPLTFRTSLNVSAGVTGIPSNVEIDFTLPGIELKDFIIPSIHFSFLNQFNIGNLITLELEIPQISLPTPQVYVRFAGIEIDVLNIFLGLILSAFNLPQGCIFGSVNIGCLNENLGQWFFSWPGFPEMPTKLPFCEKVEYFCSEIKDKLSSVTDTISKIENVINSKVASEIGKINNILQNEFQLIQSQMEGIQSQIKNKLSEIQNRIQTHIKKNIDINIDSNVLKIPPLVIPEDSIDIDLSDISSKLSKKIIININWSEFGLPDEITLPEGKQIIYDIPNIPLSKLNWEEEVVINISGLQRIIPKIEFSQPFTCKSLEPTGRLSLERSVIDSISKIQIESQKIFDISQDIINLLR